MIEHLVGFQDLTMKILREEVKLVIFCLGEPSSRNLVALGDFEGMASMSKKDRTALGGSMFRIVK